MFPDKAVALTAFMFGVLPLMLVVGIAGCPAGQDSSRNSTTSSVSPDGGDSEDGTGVLIRFPELECPAEQPATLPHRTVAAGTTLTLQGDVHVKPPAEDPGPRWVVMKVIEKQGDRERPVSGVAQIPRQVEPGVYRFHQRLTIPEGKRGQYALQVVYYHNLVFDSPLTVE